MNPVELRGATYLYRSQRRPALRSVSLNVHKRELIAVLGASGSGKSTLLRLIAGLLKPTSGEVLLRGTDASTLLPRDRRVGFVFQNLALFSNLTVWDNVSFGLRYTSLNGGDRDSRVRDLLNQLHLGELASKRPHELSGGQAQRVALARALAPRPELLLLDEPFSSLDRPLADTARALVVHLHREFELTTVLVTHDREQALSVADRIVVLSRDGAIHQAADPRTIYENPLTLEIAALTGPVNSLSGTLSRFENGEAIVDVDGTQFAARWMPERRPAAVGTQVRVGFRPEWGRFTPTKASNGQLNSLAAVVTQVSFSGSRRQLYCTSGSTEVLIEANGEEVRVNDPVWINVRPDRALAYPVEENE